MTAKNRAGLITKLQTALKKHFKPAAAAPGRPLLEHILYAALLEDAPVDLADEGFAKCEQEFFDWNEVRVTSVTELAEVFANFPAPAVTAVRLKRCLQSVFEAFYSFEIDHYKKENLGKAVAKFETMSGFSPFVMAYLIQHGLGGHAIPVNSTAIWIMQKTGIVSESEARSGKVPGLERAIPKNKAIEFASTLHQAAVAVSADVKTKAVWDVIFAVNKDATLSSPESIKVKRAPRPAKPAGATGSDAAVKSPSATKSSPAADKAAASEKAATSKSSAAKKAAAEAAVAAEAKPTGKSKPAPTAKAPAAVKAADVKEKSAAKPTGKPKAKPADDAPPEAASDKTKSKPAAPLAAAKKAAADKPSKSAESKAEAKAETAKPVKKTATKTAEAKTDSDKPAKPTKKPASKSPASGKAAAASKPEAGGADDSQAAKSKATSASAQKLTKRKPR